MIDLTKAVFMVDGHSETDAFRIKFRKLYHCVPEFRRINCNGRDVTPEGYVNRVYPTVFVALNSYFEHIVCILDREKRRVSAKRLGLRIKALLVEKIAQSTHFKKDYLERTIVVLVPDISFENWILSDIEGIKCRSDLIRADAVQEHFDGTSGVSKLKSIMIMPYKKVLHAPTLFACVFFERSVLHSESMSDFVHHLDLL